MARAAGIAIYGDGLIFRLSGCLRPLGDMIGILFSKKLNLWYRENIGKEKP